MANNSKQSRPSEATSPAERRGQALIFRLYKVREFRSKGETKKRYTEVGVAWHQADKDGTPYITIEVQEGIAVTGRLVAFIPRERE